MRRNRASRRAAFTLIELLAVLVLLALVSSIVIVRWSSVYETARSEAAVQRLEAVDQHLRSFSRSRGRPCELQIDVQNSRLRKQYGGAEKASAWESLGEQIVEARVGNGKPARGLVAVVFDRGGASPTYGIRLVGPRRSELWLVFAGVTGQLTQVDTEGDWDEAFALVASPSL